MGCGLMRLPPIRRMTLPQIARFARELAADWTEDERRQVDMIARKLDTARTRADQIAALELAISAAHLGVTRRTELLRLKRVAIVAARHIDRKDDET